MISNQPLFEICEYESENSCVFFRAQDPYGFCQNMNNRFPVEVNGIAIRNTEALYQSCRYPHLEEAQRRIIEQRSGMFSKRVSKGYRRAGHTRKDWDDIQVDVMRWVLRVKLAQNFETFGELLASTGTRPIVEQSHKDSFYGALVVEGSSTLVGCNVLGKLLMQLRDEYLNGCSESRQGMRYVPPMEISDFLLFGEPIRAIGQALVV